jgi:hypothetical protein
MNPELKTFVDSLNLEYSATFVPQSQSRNAGEKNPSLNWRVTLRKVVNPDRPASVIVATDYMQGIGHVPESEATKFKRYGHSDSIARHEYYKSVVESGRYGGAVFNKPLPPPPLLDVLYSLVMDSDADDYTFEEWCDSYGYDTDSRKAESTYNACREIGTKLRRMLGADTPAKLRELFQNY